MRSRLSRVVGGFTRFLRSSMEGGAVPLRKVRQGRPLVWGVLVSGFPALMFHVATVAGFAQGLQDSRSPATSHQPRNALVQEVILSGEVVTDDGTPLPELLQVQLVCSGRINQQTVVTSDGSFSFVLGTPRTEDWLDPTIGGSLGGTLESVVKVAPPGRSAKLDEVPSLGVGRANLRGCEIRLSPTPGFASNSIALDTRNALENPDVGRIILQRLGDGRATTVSVSFLAAPRKARDRYDKAAAELRRDVPDFEKAEKALREAVKVYPEFAAAWDLLGRIQMSQQKREEGKASLRKAVELESGFLAPREALAQAAVQESNWQEVKRISAEILELVPDHPAALYWNGMSCFYLQDFAAGVERLRRLYSGGKEERFPFGLLLLGVMEANLGDLPSAAVSLRKYLELMPPDEVPPDQRSELERQLAQWQTDGLLPVPE